MKFISKYHIVLFFGLFILASCNKETPVIENEEEVIVGLSLELTPENGVDRKVFSFIDLDGDGGEDPTILGATLEANTTYIASINVSAASEESPLGREDITNEIITEADEHQFFFEADGVDLTVEYSDFDANNLPLGQQLKITTTNMGMGNLKVTLRHQPQKDASGVSDGDITNADGETDVEVTFPVIIQ